MFLYSKYRMSSSKADYIKEKVRHRVEKIQQRRILCPTNVLLVLQKVVAGQSTISIYNELIRTQPQCGITKKKVEQIATGNCKIFEKELSPQDYQLYLSLREQIKTSRQK